MKILHVIHSVDPRSGGPSNAIRQLVAAQAHAGHEIQLLATDRQSAEPWESREVYRDRILRDPAFDGAQVRVMRAFGRRRPWRRYAFAPGCGRTLRQMIGQGEVRPDVVHIHGAFSHVTSAAATAARDLGIPYVIRPAGCLDWACYASGHQVLKRLFSRLVLFRDVRRAACVQATTEAEAEEIRRWLPGTRVVVVPLGAAVPDRDDLVKARGAFLSRSPQLRNRQIVLYMSRIAPKKRLDLLVEAVGLLRDDLPELMLVVAGQDSGHLSTVEESIRRTRLAERVMFTGFLQGELKHGALAAASLFALPSIDENFGVAVVEAMAHGVPVIVTPGVGARVFVEESGCGRTVDDNAAAIAAGIRQLLSEDRNDVGDRGRRYVANYLSWNTVAKQLDALYRDLCAKPHAGLSTPVVTVTE